MPERYEAACALLPRRLREAAMAVGEKGKIEELRLRRGERLGLTLPEGEMAVPGTRVTREDLEAVLDLSTGCSRYTAAQSLRQGYLTAEGGFRIGVCGTAVVEGGQVAGYRDLSSLNIRIPREQLGLADRVLPRLLTDGVFRSTLVVSPPGGGKTTLLRDLVRALSDERNLRVSLVDERGELAAIHQGAPQLRVGRHPDVLDACPKALAIPALLRAMTPQVIAVDEVAVAEDVSALELAAGAGAALLATVHGGTVADLRRKPVLAGMLDLGLFQRAVCIARVEDGRGDAAAPGERPLGALEHPDAAQGADLLRRGTPGGPSDPGAGRLCPAPTPGGTGRTVPGSGTTHGAILVGSG